MTSQTPDQMLHTILYQLKNEISKDEGRDLKFICRLQHYRKRLLFIGPCIIVIVEE